jgi:hypothetical protein
VLVQMCKHPRRRSWRSMPCSRRRVPSGLSWRELNIHDEANTNFELINQEPLVQAVGLIGRRRRMGNTSQRCAIWLMCQAVHGARVLRKGTLTTR